MHACAARGRVIVLSFGLFVCTKSGHSEASLWALLKLATYESEIQYIPHERERTSGSREKQPLFTLLKIPFLYLERLLACYTSKLQSGDRISGYLMALLHASCSSEMNFLSSSQVSTSFLELRSPTLEPGLS